ncbi:MAG: hypothetical protein OFPII_19010 [Osedax symbiont Rs1]|nr:MAG: hypothetical protein OFPII_19010 [Osedax symbiont Rs1]
MIQDINRALYYVVNEVKTKKLTEKLQSLPVQMSELNWLLTLYSRMQ